MASVINPGNASQTSHADVALISKALDLAFDYYKVSKTDKAQEKYDELQKKMNDQSSAQKQTKDNLDLNEKFALVPEQTPGAFKSLLPDGSELPQGMALLPRQTMAQREKQQADMKMEQQKLAMQNRDKQAAEKAPNDAMFRSAQFGRRAEAADNLASQLETDQSFNPAGAKANLSSQWFFPNVMKSEPVKKYQQAQLQFVNSVLRPESGASISDSEREAAIEQYFPKQGDSEDVIAQKRDARRQAIAGLQAAAGNAWDKVPSVVPTAFANKDKQNFGEVNAAIADKNKSMPKIQLGGGSIFTHTNGKRYRVTPDGKDAIEVK